MAITVVEASDNTNTNIALLTTPAAGDVIVLATLQGRGTPRTILSASGCGATWTKVYSGGADRITYWIGTGATASGNVTWVPDGSITGGFGSAMWLIRGLTGTTVAGAFNGTAAGAVAMTGPTQTAAAGQIVVAAGFGGNPIVFPSAQTPASGWVQAPGASGQVGGLHAIPTTSASYRVDLTCPTQTVVAIAQIVIGPVPPAAPSGLSFLPSPETLTLYWGAVAGATSYDVRIDGGTPVTGITDLSHLFSGLEYETAYLLEVRAVNGVGASGWASITGTTLSRPPDPEAPSPPLLVTTGATQPPALTIVADGLDLQNLGAYGDLMVTHRLVGSWSLEWGMNLPVGYRPRQLREDAAITARSGPGDLFVGTIRDANWEDQTFRADGIGRQAETALALDGSGNLTQNPREAVTEAIARGALDWDTAFVATTLPTTVVFTDEPERAVYVAELLDLWADETGVRWSVDAQRRIVATADPTTPKWIITPGAVTLGTASDDTPNTLVGRYKASGGLATAIRPAAPAAVRRERGVDLTRLGTITAAKANAILDGILAKAATTGAWSNPITVTADQITNAYGVKANLSMVEAGHMARVAGMPDPRSPKLATDVLIEESTWDVRGRTITLSPLGLAARTLEEIVEDAGGVLL